MTRTDKQVHGSQRSHKCKPGLNYLNIFWLAGCHIAAIGCFFFFSFGAMLAGLTVVLVVGFGISMGFHRLLSHRSFKTSVWMRRVLATLGTLAAQRGPAEWVAIHRMHHKGSDTVDDPHNAARGFLYSHIGWLFVNQPQFYDKEKLRRFSRDILDDPWLAFLSRSWVGYGAQIVMFGLLYATLGPDYAFFCTAGRLLVNYHCTFLGNSVGHRFGTRLYRTSDSSINSKWLAMVTLGEGYHNNHHAAPHIAVNARQPGDIDLTGWMIAALAKTGLVWDVNLPADSQSEVPPWARCKSGPAVLIDP